MRKNLIDWLWAPLIAVQFLTRIPIRGIPDWAYEESAGRGKSFVFYPLVGVIVGAAGAGALLLLRRAGLPAAAASILAVAAMAAVTGAFHEDGMADTADALGPHNREDALKAMRDSRIGTFGVVALWTLLSLKAVALTGLPHGSAWKAIIAAHVLARWSSLPMSIALPYARSTPGLGERMASAITPMSVAGGTAVAAALTLALLGPMPASKCAAAACAVMAASGLFYVRKFGGVTGDCLGATNQIVEVVTLLVILL